MRDYSRALADNTSRAQAMNSSQSMVSKFEAFSEAASRAEDQASAMIPLLIERAKLGSDPYAASEAKDTLEMVARNLREWIENVDWDDTARNKPSSEFLKAAKSAYDTADYYSNKDFGFEYEVVSRDASGNPIKYRRVDDVARWHRDNPDLTGHFLDKYTPEQRKKAVRNTLSAVSRMISEYRKLLTKNIREIPGTEYVSI